MVSLIGFLDASVRMVVFYLLSTLWMGFGIAVVVGCVAWLFRHAPAVVVHRIWWAGLLSILIVPSFCVFSSGERAGLHQPQDVTVRGLAALRAQVDKPPASDSESISPLLARSDGDAWKIGWPYAVFGLWLVGAVGMALRLVVYALRMCGLSQNRMPVERDLQNPFGLSKRFFAIRHPVPVYASDRISSPMVSGAFHSAIYLPQHLWEQLSELELEHIAVHEMGHIYRHDAYGILLQRLAECVLWFNPGTWWIGERIALTREMACDEWVVRTKRDARSYAQSLARVASLAQSQGTAVLSVQAVHRRSALLKRIEHLMSAHRLTANLSRWGMGIAAVSLLVLTIGFSYITPLFDVPGRAEAYMRLAQFSQTVANLVIGNPLPRGTGMNRRVVVIADEEDARALEPELTRLLMKPILTPQPESVFQLMFAPPEELSKLQTQKNLILVARSESNGPVKKAIEQIFQNRPKPHSNGFIVERDVWANTQTVVGLVADDSEQLVQRAALQGDQLFAAFESSLSAWLTDILYHSGVATRWSKRLSDRFGWWMRIPVGFELLDQHADDGFVALVRQYDRRQVWVWVYWEDGVPPDRLTADWCIEKRNEVGQRFFDGDVIDPSDISVFDTEFCGKLAVCLTGLWENKAAWQGGPFKSYAIVDSEHDRFYLINLGVYAPNREKVLHLMQLDVLARTFNLAPMYAMTGD